MKPPILVGVALAVLILAASLLLPVFRSSAQKSAEQAREQAELARRELARVSLTLPRLDDLADAKKLKDANLDAAAQTAAKDLKRISNEGSEALRSAQNFAKNAGLKVPEAQPPAPNAAGARKAVADFQTAVKDNDALLKSALSAAQSANSADKSVMGVAQALGMAEYVRAVNLYAESITLRSGLAEKLAELLDVVTEWKAVRGRAGYFQELQSNPDLDKLRDELRGDVTELGTTHELAAANVEQLRQQVQQQEQALAKVNDALREARQALLDLEKQGFTAGDDSSFNAYRERYLALSGQLQKLEEQEQELRYGGVHGAEFVGVDPTTAELRGGQPTIGLDVLRQNLEMAQRRTQRLGNANVAIEAQIKFITDTGQEAQKEAARYTSRSAALDARQKAVFEEVKTQAAAAMAKESEALKAAEAAARAFDQAQNAAQGWVREAREAQQNRDPARKNERITKLLQDPYVEQVSDSAASAARVLVARIQADRADGCERLLNDMRLVAALNPDLTFDPAETQTAIDTARKDGNETLSKARNTYDKLSKAQVKTVWVPQAALAAAQHLTARLAVGDSAKWISDALESIQKAVEKREQSPYLAMYVRFRDHLAGAAPKPAETPQPAGEGVLPGGE